MSEQLRPPGKTTIAPDVLVSIARLTTLGVPGVSRLAPVPGDVNRLFNKGITDGVKITIEDNTVFADLYVFLKRDFNVRDVSRIIQTQVSRAIAEMVGMDVGRVNVHVEEIDFTEEGPAQ